MTIFFYRYNRDTFKICGQRRRRFLGYRGKWRERRICRSVGVTRKVTTGSQIVPAKKSGTFQDSCKYSITYHELSYYFYSIFFYFLLFYLLHCFASDSIQKNENMK